MKLEKKFREFLADTVNLNETRLGKLSERAETIQEVLRTSDVAPKIIGFLEHGSWAHQTIIRPQGNKPFDADLIIRLKHLEGWSAADYINELARVFRESSRYKDKVRRFDYCVTIQYADECTIDVAPLVEDRDGFGSLEVCNRRQDNFEPSRPQVFTDWLRE